MKTKPVIHYHHRGQVKAQDGSLVEIYSIGEHSIPEDGGMTRMECIADARKRGGEARFNYGNLEERANFTQPHPTP